MPLPAPLSPPPPISAANLVRWARRAISGNVGPFAIATSLSLLVLLLTQYSVQLAATLINRLGQGGGKASPPPEGPVGRFMAAIVPDDIRTVAVLFAIVGLATIVLAFLNGAANAWSNSLMLKRLQQDLHDKLLQLGPNYHSRHDLGENSAMVTQFASMAQPMLRDVIGFPFVRGVALVSAIMFLLYNLNQLSAGGGAATDSRVFNAVLVAVVILLPVGGWWMSRRLPAAFGAVRDKQTALNNALVDSLSAPQEIQVLNAAKRRSAAFGMRLTELVQAQVRAAVRSELNNQFQTAIPKLLQTALLIYAVFYLVSTGNEEVGVILAIYQFVPSVVDPIQQLIRFFSALNTAWPQIEKVGRTLDEPVEVQDTGRKHTDQLGSYALALKNVRYAPQPERVIIDDVSFEFPENKVTSIVGRSGSGKTTILRLVARLSDPNQGRIEVGGTDIRHLRLSALRSLIGTVSQFPLFIEADVRENLALAAPSATDAEMEAALRVTGLWPILQHHSPSDPLALAVPRTAGKSGLSGGERRLLAISRALLVNPRILLLDEPSTGIDAMTLGKIVNAIREARAGRTVLLVDHDMDLVGSVSDQICCIEEGRFTDIGTPAELMARPSLFARLSDAKRMYTDQAEYEVQGSVPVRPAELPAAPGAAGMQVGMKKAAPGMPPPGMSAPPPGLKAPPPGMQRPAPGMDAPPPELKPIG